MKPLEHLEKVRKLPKKGIRRVFDEISRSESILNPGALAPGVPCGQDIYTCIANKQGSRGLNLAT